jgi:hypothetical protein
VEAVRDRTPEHRFSRAGLADQAEDLSRLRSNDRSRIAGTTPSRVRL